MNASQRRKVASAARAEGVRPDVYPAKCPITGRPYFMTLNHPQLGMVPTYGGPYDSYTIPRALGEPTQRWHERELEQSHYDHDFGGWVDDETIPLRIVHDDVLDDALGTLQCADNVLGLLQPEVDRLGCKAGNVRQRIQAAIAALQPQAKEPT